MKRLLSLALFLVSLCSSALLAQNVRLAQWKVPDATTSAGDLTRGAIFISVAPCRLADTRNATGTFGGPGFSPGTIRTFPIPSGPCPSLPAAAAYSLNFTIVNYNVGNGGFITAWPSALPRPFVSTLNFGTGGAIANAAVVAASGGAISVYASDTTHVIVDINGYYIDSGSWMNTGDQLSLAGSVDTSGILRGLNKSTSPTLGTSGVQGVVTAAVDNVAGVWGESAGNATNFGVVGVVQAGYGGAAGVLGSVSGRMPVNGSWADAGVRGETANGDMGVFGISQYVGTAGVKYDLATGATRTYGFLGFDHYGVYSLGDLAATGTKAFVEPHPTDASKVIRYVTLEGPEAGTYFRGRGRFVDHQAVIDVPESFRLVTDEEGMTVHITPIGAIASFAVTSMSLDRITAEATRDVEFSYIVYGVRKGYRDFEAIAQGNEFIPRTPDARMPAGLNPVQKQHLIDNGTYNADGTVNLSTATRLGWDKKWGADK